MSRQPRMTKEWIEVLFDYGIDKGNRRIFLFDDIDVAPIGMVIKGLYYMDSESHDPIELFVGSPGGYVYDMFALYDAIQTLQSPVHTTAMGKCLSAAPLLVCAGEKGFRYATPNTFFMVHRGTTDLGENRRTEEIATELKHLNVAHIRWCELMGKHTKKDSKFWQKLCNQVGDKYFDAYQAQEWGMVDHVWDEKGGN